MRRFLSCSLFTGVAWILCLPAPSHAQPVDNALAAQATELLKSHCYRCHGESFNGSAKFNVMDPPSLLANGYANPASLDESKMWDRIKHGEMPPEDSGVPQLTPAEQQVIQAWILAGVPEVQRLRRPFKSHEAVIRDIHGFLSRMDSLDAKYTRFITLTHLNNNYEKVSDFDLRLYRAAFCKAINSLSREPDIYVPQFIDEEQTIFAIDIRRLGWTFEDWGIVVDDYPYGFRFSDPRNQALVQLDSEIDRYTGTAMCWIRADWLVNAATRPPIYDRLLQLPTNCDELETRLNVDFARNFRDNRLARAGFATSGVSNGNRLVERHPALHGYYWKSYDFKDKGTAGNLFLKPLGPAFPGNTYARGNPNDPIFQHDGGEMIFSLPNGLQGYYLSDHLGNQIQKGPIEVVRDLKETGGTAEVLNGLSCMHCHRHGMIDFKDTVRLGTALQDQLLDKVTRLYPEENVMNQYLAADRDRFLRALEQCVGPYMRVGEDAQRPITEFAEPIGAVARFYQRDLNLADVACELGVEDPNAVKAAIQFNPELVRMGLAPLMNGDTIKRSDWEGNDAFVSPFQETISQMRLGTPVN